MTHNKSFQSPEGEKALSCPLCDCLSVFVGDVDTKELEVLNLFHCSPVNENGSVLGPPFPIVHNHLLCLDQVEGEVDVLAPHSQVLTSSL